MGQTDKTMTPENSGLPVGVSRELLLFAVIGALIQDTAAVGSAPASENVGALTLPGIGAPDQALREEAERILDRYDNDTFWHELIHRLGERDFERRATDEELSALDAGGPYPERVAWHYDLWKRETAEHGIERIEIVDDDDFQSREAL